MRKLYLDNLRSISILLLFPYHVFMIYNNWGEPFYVHGAELAMPSILNLTMWLWMMPLLFAVAGMSSRYALKKRSAQEYARERVSKLLIPLVFSMLLILPVQSYIASLRTGDASYFGYFTSVTDFTGYDGAFTPGHLWFIAFLFVISMVSLPFMMLYNKKGKGTLGGSVPLIAIMLMGLLPCLGNVIFDISGKSPTEYLAYFLLGYFFLADETVQERLDKYRFLLLGAAVLGAALTFYFDHMFFEAASWLAILAVLGLGRHYLERKGRVWAYLSGYSFGIYLFHQSWIIIVGYFALKWTGSYWIQIPLILVVSAALTWLTNELARRVSFLRKMFGLKR